ncbi:MAG: ATPase [Sphingomonas sp.]
MRCLPIFIAALAAAAPAAAEVRSSSASGFVVETTATVPVPPADAYAALVRVGRWWNSAHTYSGDAANMTIEPRAGGCFCEAVPADGGSIEHGRVIHARPAQTLRVQGALGPLQAEAALGTLTWSLRATDSGTEITQTYVVGGHMRGGFEAVAPLVDQVLAEQLRRLTEHLRRPA